MLLHQDYVACSSDLQEVLQLDPDVPEAEKELEEVTCLLRESLAKASPAKPRKTVPITEVGVFSPRSSWSRDNIKEFNQPNFCCY